MSVVKNNNWSYMIEGLKAEGHTPIYKMHKYFARRPQNVFSALVKNYSEARDIILDPFGGGGVTMVEGSALNRHVVSNDINPLAAFITKCEATKVGVDNYLLPMLEILSEVRSFAEPFYLTHNRDTGEQLPVRWYEYTYIVECPHCGGKTLLGNENKKTVNGKQQNGWYSCCQCGADIQGASSKHIGAKMLTVTYKKTTRETQRTVSPDNFDFEIEEQANRAYQQFVVQDGWFVPDIQIPEKWDRQQEDCLIRKGFNQFSDFFSKRTLLVMSFFLRAVKRRKNKVSPEVYDLLLLTFSATLRYTNNMTISTSMWQDGRPVAWAKHAYWMSYQFVEVNPIEYIEKRIQAIKSALLFQEKKFENTVKFIDSFEEITDSPENCLLLNTDSSHLPIPDESVDLVLTDPPYGGNVQYGELSAFWLAWIYDELNISKECITDLAGEILVHRKNKTDAKTYQTYYEGLNRVYSECYRVLKKGQPLVFTFNSKDAKVWLAVLKAVLDAGFVLEPEGIIYQEPIENYKNTAHTMAAGTVHGDFIYSFVKPKEQVINKDNSTPEQIKEMILNTIDSVILEELGDNECRTISELYIAVLRRIIPLLAKLALSKKDFDFTSKLIGGKIIEDAIQRKCECDDEDKWRLIQ